LSNADKLFHWLSHLPNILYIIIQHLIKLSKLVQEDAENKNNKLTSKTQSSHLPSNFVCDFIIEGKVCVCCEKFSCVPEIAYDIHLHLCLHRVITHSFENNVVVNVQDCISVCDRSFRSNYVNVSSLRLTLH
jgi:hypothetical protein